MAKDIYLNVVLKCMALYAGTLATFTLFFQPAGSVVFQYSIIDPTITRYWGGVLLAMAIFYLFLSTDPVKYRLFIWVGVFDLGTAMILTIMNMSVGAVSWVQGLIGVVINPIFIMVLLYGLAHKPEGEVLLVSGDGLKSADGIELPAHLAGQHPLNRK